MYIISPKVILEVIREYQQINHFIISYSGGIDSHVLLHLLVTNRHYWPSKKIEAIYVNHNLNQNAQIWGKHCSKICQAMNIPYKEISITVQLYGNSYEAAARQARYNALATQLGTNSALFSAHHSNDQAETVLLQLLRGVGPRGLAAMPKSAPLGRGLLLRPLLDISKNQILLYAQDNKLQWIEDDSNINQRFDRNYLRQSIIPLIANRWPAFNKTLTRSAKLCAEIATWLDQEAYVDLKINLNKLSKNRIDILSITQLNELSTIRCKNLIRYWLRCLGFPIPNKKQLQHVIQDILNANRSRQPCVRWPGVEIRRYRDMMYAMQPNIHNRYQIFFWRPNFSNDFCWWPPLVLPGIGLLEMRETYDLGLRKEILSNTILTVKFRSGGEKFHPTSRQHSQILKKLFQEAEIPPWERDRIPLIYQDHKLLAVVGLGISSYVSVANTPSWQPVLTISNNHLAN